MYSRSPDQGPNSTTVDASVADSLTGSETGRLVAVGYLDELLLHQHTSTRQSPPSLQADLSMQRSKRLKDRYDKIQIALNDQYIWADRRTELRALPQSRQTKKAHFVIP